jgi:tetratricopeptide (TPR) repeat protein
MSNKMTPFLRPHFLALCVLAAVCASCSKQPESKQTVLARGKEFLSAGQFLQAEKEYREALRLASNDPEALRGLAITYYDQGQLQQAFPLLKQAADANTDDLEVRMRLGLTYFSGRELKLAREIALGILEKQPSHEDALLLAVDTAATPEDIAETQKLIDDYLKTDKDRASYHLARGALDLREKQEARAETEFKRALELDPKSAAVYSALGNLYWSRKDLAAAESALKTAADLSPTNSIRRLRYVDFKLATGAIPEATKIVEDLSRQNPEYLPPRVYLMKQACQDQNSEQCSTKVQEILSAYPLNYDALFQRGLLSLHKGEAAQAVAIFNQLATNYAYDARAKYQLALAYLLFAKSATPVENRNAFEGAERNLTLAAQLAPELWQAAVLLADLKIRKGNAAAGVELLLPVVANQPEVPEPQYLLGSAYAAQQKGDQALAVYRRMSELFPKDPKPSYEAARILLAQQKPAAAREAFEKSLTISADYAPAVESLVDLDLSQQQYDQARARIAKLIGNVPKLATPWVSRGQIALAQKDFASAEQDFLKAISLDSKLERARLWLAQLYMDTNRPERAVETLTSYIENNKTVPALIQLGQIQQGLKQFEKARNAYEELLRIAPDFVPALNNLAVVYSEHLGQLDTAFELAKKARALNPNEPSIGDTLGWILYQKADYRTALRQLEQSAKVADNPVIVFHLGMTHYMLGDDASARVAFQKAVDSGKEFAERTEARRRLELLVLLERPTTPATRAQVEKYLTERPNDPMALTWLARAQVQDGSNDLALKNLEKVVADNPQFAPATRELVLLYARQPTSNPKAYELTTKARQAYPDDPEITKTLGMLDYQRGAYPQAADLLKAAAEQRADDPELLYYLGASYQQLKRWAECKGALQRASTLNLPVHLRDSAKRILDVCSETAPL